MENLCIDFNDATELKPQGRLKVAVTIRFALLKALGLLPWNYVLSFFLNYGDFLVTVSGCCCRGFLFYQGFLLLVFVHGDLQENPCQRFMYSFATKCSSLLFDETIDGQKLCWNLL